MSRNWTLPIGDPGVCLGEGRVPPGRMLARRRGAVRCRRRRLWLLPVALLLAMGGLWTFRAVWRADRFAVQQVETGPYRFTDRTVLDRLLAEALGRSIWSGVERELQAAIAALPWVREAQVRRVLPDRLVVLLAEWQPLCLVAAPPGDDGIVAPLLLVGDGRLLPAPRHLPAPVLPWLIGGEPVWCAEEAAWRLPPAQAAQVAEMAVAVAVTGLETAAPIDFVLVDDDGFSIVLQGGRERLRLGSEEFAARLRRYLAVRGELAAGAIVDLRFGNQVVTRDPPQRQPSDLAQQPRADRNGTGDA